ncbi:MAG TPA: trypco2 family protein [Blastocatellia bacterium]|nr:trypco2 family protein [Blastocatellia bacterium]
MSKDKGEINDADIPLADMIQALRRELEAAQKSSAGQAIMFQTEKVELELKVAVSHAKKGQGGIEFYVKVGGEFQKSNEIAHTFKLTLVPVAADGSDRVLVGAETDEAPSGLTKE